MTPTDQLLAACKAMVAAQHAGPITDEMFKAWEQGRAAISAVEAENQRTKSSTNLNMLEVALHEAEDELCTLGATLVNEGWDTMTIKLTLDVVRIALYGGDGDGQGPEHFGQARNTLKTQRLAEERAA